MSAIAKEEGSDAGQKEVNVVKVAVVRLNTPSLVTDLNL